jgi:hypothetical protein
MRIRLLAALALTDTLPSKLRDIAYHNKRVVYDLLMKAAAETTLAIATAKLRCPDI